MGDTRAVLCVPRDDWLYYRIHVPDTAAADRLLTEVLHPAVKELYAELPPASNLRWFFMRFMDSTGMHVRLRLCADLRALSRAEHVLDSAIAGAARPELPLCSSYGKYLYSPEIEKFGADEGIRLAEDIFQISSEMVLEFLTAETPRSPVGYAAANIIAMLTGLPESQWAAFLHQYAWYWAGGPARRGVTRAPAGPGQERAARQLPLVLAGARRALADQRIDGLGTGDRLRGYSTQFWAAVKDGPERHTASRSDFFHLFHHLHLTNNRLGVYPAAESSLARMLWLACASGDLPRI